MEMEEEEDGKFQQNEHHHHRQTDRETAIRADRPTARTGEERLGNCVGKWVETLLLERRRRAHKRSTI